MEINMNPVVWFEIPFSNIERGIKFYEMAWFPNAHKPGVPGSLVHDKKFYKPSQEGVLIYFSSLSGF